jgi:predicted MFS family arabinose efflux permease
LGVVGFVGAELLPVSLLTPIARDLQVSEGVAGQTITVTALVAMFASLFGASITRAMDRRIVLLAYAGLLVVSNVLAAISPNFSMLMLSRVVLGIGLGGFWSMAPAVGMRLVPENDVPRAFAIIFGGASVATIMAAPLGTFLGEYAGWRGVFLATAAITVLALVWQFVAVPTMPPTGRSKLGTFIGLLKRPVVRLGMFSLMTIFAGHFALLTYLRPFMETITHLDVGMITIVLLAFGIANVLGTSLAGSVVARNLGLTQGLAPLVGTAIAFGLVVVGTTPILAGVLIVAWGFMFGTVPVAWSTWLTRAIPDEVESGGGLQVAVIQLAITGGAGLGGVLFDVGGPMLPFAGSGVMFFTAALIILVFMRGRQGSPSS